MTWLATARERPVRLTVPPRSERWVSMHGPLGFATQRMSASRAGGADWGADGFGDPPSGAASPDPPLDAWAYPHRTNSPSMSTPENVAYVLVACRGLFDP